MKFKVCPIGETGHGLLQSDNGANVTPDISVQLPSEVAEQLARAANKAPELIQALKTIQNLCDNPHWTNERKYRIRELAHNAWTNF